MGICCSKDMEDVDEIEAIMYARSLQPPKPPNPAAVATFAGGCFWAIEAAYKNLRGVLDVVSGYIGGNEPNPTYDLVCSGTTNYVQAVQVTYDERLITYAELCSAFWRIHDPTLVDRQGNDIGSEYRSMIFYHNNEQRRTAIISKEAITQSNFYRKPIVTKIVPATTFHPAEEIHQSFFKKFPDKAYCKCIIEPNLNKFMEMFRKKLKPEVQEELEEADIKAGKKKRKEKFETVERKEDHLDGHPEESSSAAVV